MTATVLVSLTIATSGLFVMVVLLIATVRSQTRSIDILADAVSKLFDVMNRAANDLERDRNRREGR